MKWILVVILICATTLGDVFRSLGMRKHGEIRDFRPGAIGSALGMVARNSYVIVSTCAMAVSFFSFMKLVSIAPMSFAVPMSAAAFIPGDSVRAAAPERSRRLAALGRSRADPRRRRVHYAVIAVVLVACGVAYHVLAIVAALRFRPRDGNSGFHAPGVDSEAGARRRPAVLRSHSSHAVQQYPEFELLFGTADPEDPALADIEKLRAEYPAIPIRVIDTANDAPNGKVGSLEILARHAQHAVLLVNDGDIVVPRGLSARVSSVCSRTKAWDW